MRAIPSHSKNRPSLVVHDLRTEVPADTIYDSLFHRGILKLFYVREQAWRLVDLWLRVGKEAGVGAKRHSKEYWRGYAQCALDDRAELKRILSTPKMDAIPNDPDLLRYMEERTMRELPNIIEETLQRNLQHNLFEDAARGRW